MSDEPTDLSERSVPIRCLPLPEGVERMESGPLRFGDDWPGVYIRGDQALNWAHALGRVLDSGAEDFFTVAQLRSLQAALLTCDTNSRAGELARAMYSERGY